MDWKQNRHDRKLNSCQRVKGSDHHGEKPQIVKGSDGSRRQRQHVNVIDVTVEISVRETENNSDMI